MVLILLQKETCLQNAFAMAARIPGDTTTRALPPTIPVWKPVACGRQRVNQLCFNLRVKLGKTTE